MKNIFKTSKRSIAAILTLCILLGVAGTCVYAASVMSEEITTVTQETIVAAEETLQELVPVMASACEDDYYRSGRPYVPANAIPVPGTNGIRTVKPNTSNGFINFILCLGLGFSGQGWQYSMQDFYIPGESAIYYDHYWFHEDYPGSVFHHRRS